MAEVAIKLAELLDQIDYGDGPPPLKEKLRKLCYEFRDIIDDKLDEQPAKVDQERMRSRLLS